MDKTTKHMDSLSAKAAKSQGGGNRDQGPKGAGNVKSGDSVKSRYTTQDQSRSQGGPPKNKYHDV